jgi:hypothetical protein
MAKFRYKRKMGKAFPDISGSINVDDRRAFDAYREVAARRGARFVAVRLLYDSVTLDVTRLPAGEAAARILDHCGRSSR